MSPLILLIGLIANTYFVKFTCKDSSSFLCMSEQALLRRQTADIELDSLDYSVSSVFLDSLRSYGATICHTSRWINGATCYLPDSALTHVSKLPFVLSITQTRNNTTNRRFTAKRSPLLTNTPIYAPDTYSQLKTYNLIPLHRLGYKGENITIAICDGGFTNANGLSWIDSEHFLGHRDFTDDIDDFFGSSGLHGTYCLSAIAGHTSTYNGAAPEVDFYLLRSEEAETESPKEMDNLIAALEFADSVGAHIFSASLGYYYFDNPEWDILPSELNGTHRCSQAATIAARKGMLVCIAAGNEGNTSWGTIDIPADADSILTVGAVRTDSVIASFSSRGPSADGRVKPEVCAVGVQTALLPPYSESVAHSNGTSFACPLLAGMAASLWSAVPNLTAMQIRNLIIQSANRINNPHNAYGYGIPNAYTAYLNATTGIEHTNQTFSATTILQNGSIYLLINGKYYDILGRPCFD